MKLSKATVIANRQAIMEVMRQHGCKSACVSYSGSGDSGGIEDVEVEGLGDHEPSVKVMRMSTTFNGEGWDNKLSEVSMPLAEAIRELCYDLLSRDHCGWENDSGGSGQFYFDIERDVIKWDHTEYYTESNTTTAEV